jgi:hypothetical protein
VSNDFSKLDSNVLERGLAKPALRALVNAELYALDQILKFGSKALSTMNRIGPTAIHDLFPK